MSDCAGLLLLSYRIALRLGVGAVFVEFLFSDAIAVVEVDPLDILLHLGEERGDGFGIFDDGLFGTLNNFVSILLHLLSITEVLLVEEIQLSNNLIHHLDFRIPIQQNFFSFLCLCPRKSIQNHIKLEQYAVLQFLHIPHENLVDFFPLSHDRLDSAVDIVVVVLSAGVIAVHAQSVEWLDQFIDHSDFVFSV